MRAARVAGPGVRSLLGAAAFVLGCEAVSLRRPTRVVEAQKKARPSGGARGGVDESIFKREALELNSVLHYALEQSPELKAARHRLKAAEHHAFAAGYLPEPRLSYGHSLAPVETRNGPIDGALTLSQAFPWYGRRRAQRRAAGFAADVEEEALYEAELDVLLRVKRAYFAVYLTREALKVNAETELTLERVAAAARANVRAGRGGQADVLQVEVEMARLENERLDLEQKLATHRALLNTLLNRPAGAHLPPPAIGERKYAAKIEDLLGWMRENLPEIKRHERLIELNRARAEVARLKRFPDIVAGLQYTAIGDGGEDAWAASVGATVPVWVGKYREEELGAREAALAAEAAKEHVENLAVYRVLELHVRVETSLREVELYREIVLPKSRETLKLLESAYRAGRLGFLRLMDAERALERYELAEKRAVTEFESRFADLERAVGRPLKETRR